MSYAAYLTIAMVLWLGCNIFFCAWIYKRYKSGLDPRVLSILKRQGELEIEMSDLTSLYDRLMLSHKRLRASAGMAHLRGKKTAVESEESDAAILKRLGLIGASK